MVVFSKSYQDNLRNEISVLTEKKQVIDELKYMQEVKLELEETAIAIQDLSNEVDQKIDKLLDRLKEFE